MNPIVHSSIIILMGPPGSGKGTQAARITQQLHIPHISTGDLFRENMSQATALGRQAKEYIQAGQLVPDELVLSMLSARLSQKDCSQGFLLDGFPRTLSQAEALGKLLHSHMVPIVIALQVPDEVIIERMAGRLLCKQCGHIQHKSFSPPKKEGHCDRCQGELFQRSDDKEEVIKERLKVYHRQTQPLLRFYGDKGILHLLSGNENPDIVFQKAMIILSPDR